jgi:hypothetical protein
MGENEMTFRAHGTPGQRLIRRIERTLLMGFVAAVWFSTSATALPVTYEAATPSDNATERQNWLDAMGIASPQHLVDFESGFSNGENISGITGLFPAGLVITDTSPAADAIIRSGSGVIAGSNPVGAFSLTQNEEPYLELDFSASPVDYVGILDIDHVGTPGIVTFVGGATWEFSLDSAPGSGDTAEFFGLFRNDQPRITLIQFDSAGDYRWGVDNIEYGVVPEPSAVLLLASGLLGLAARRGWRS